MSTRTRSLSYALLAQCLILTAVAGTVACRQEAPPMSDTAKLAVFDSILSELGGPVTASLDRGQRWRMISSTGAGLPPLSFQPSLLPEPGSAGNRLIQFYCVQCHGLPVPHMHTAEEWPAVLRRMLLRAQTLSHHMGGRVTERLLGEMRMAGMASANVPSQAERDTLLAYLQRHAFPGVSRSALPDLPGREAFLNHCATCHAPPNPKAYSADQWELVVARMQSNMSAMDVVTLSDQEKNEILAFLKQAGG